MGNRSGREMSDIKYVIAGGDDDGGEHTRFPCLDMVRYAMAAAVTTLAIAVIVSVIHAVFRPEDVGLSINNGYISADILWERTVQAGVGNVQPGSAVLSEKKLAKEPEEVDVTQDSHQLTADFSVGSSSSDDGLPRECFLGCDDDSGSSGVQHRPPTQQVTYALSKAKTTNLRVILVAKNPGGCTRIDCNGTTVRLLDMRARQHQIGSTLELGNFTVPPQTTITLLQRLQINDTTYIWENYRGEVRFSVKVEVRASITSYPLNKPNTKVQTYMCQPVTVGLMDYEAVYANQVDCWAGAAPPPSPAPAPAPAPAPSQP